MFLVKWSGWESKREGSFFHVLNESMRRPQVVHSGTNECWWSHSGTILWGIGQWHGFSLRRKRNIHWSLHMMMGWEASYLKETMEKVLYCLWSTTMTLLFFNHTFPKILLVLFLSLFTVSKQGTSFSIAILSYIKQSLCQTNCCYKMEGPNETCNNVYIVSYRRKNRWYIQKKKCSYPRWWQSLIIEMRHISVLVHPISMIPF